MIRLPRLLEDRRIFLLVALVASGPAAYAAYAFLWSNALFAAGMLVWGLLPVGAALMLFRFRLYGAAWGWITAILVLGYVVLQAVRTSDSSTASIDFLFLPGWSLAIAGPIGAGVGHYLARLAGWTHGTRVGPIRVLHSSRATRTLAILWGIVGVALVLAAFWETREWRSDPSLAAEGFMWWPLTGIVPAVLSGILAYHLYRGTNLAVGYILSSALAACVLVALALTPFQFIVQPMLALKILAIALCLATSGLLYRAPRSSI